jgi:transglutaminase-like putative cysteine protease
VKEYAVGLDDPGLHTVRSLVRALTTRGLFVRVDRRAMARWHQDPDARTSWLARLRRISDRVARLEATARKRLLDGEEAAELNRARRTLRRMQRQDAAWLAVYSRALPRDYPFVLTGRHVLELGVLDGCTTASRAFSVLARAAGLEVRLVGASNLDTLRGIWQPGRERAEGGVNGHKMALVRIEGRWHLVNTNSHAPARDPSYEIFDTVNGKPVTPETLPGQVLRLPSMQVDDGRRSPRLVVTNVGSPDAEDLGEHTFAANLNLAVSGDPSSPLCRNPALVALLGGQAARTR